MNTTEIIKNLGKQTGGDPRKLCQGGRAPRVVCLGGSHSYRLRVERGADLPQIPPRSFQAGMRQGADRFAEKSHGLRGELRLF